MYICFILQTVVPPARIEERVIDHPGLLTVAVPVGTQETTARPEVCSAAHTTMQHGGSWSMEHACTYICMYIFSLQTVVQPVRTEEHAIVHLPTLTATVPVGTQESTARPEVCSAAHTTMQHRSSWSMEHARAYEAYMYIHMYVQ